MSVTVNLRDFLAPLTYREDLLVQMPEPEASDLQQWRLFFRKSLRLESISLQLSAINSRSALLLLVEDTVLGALLVRNIPSVFAGDELEVLNLSTGQVSRMQQLPQTASRAWSLFEVFDWHTQWSVKRIGKYVFAPVRRLLRQSLFLHGLLALTQSTLFMVNFNILAYVVPDGAMAAYQVLLWLFFGTVITIFLGNYILQKIQNDLDRVTKEREEVLRLSLIWACKPKIFHQIDAAKIMEMAQLVVASGRRKIDIMTGCIAALVFIPIIILMYLRLPASLFIAVITLCVASATVQILLQRKQYRLQRKIALSEASDTQSLFSLLTHSYVLKYYAFEKFRIGRWATRVYETAMHSNKLNRQGLALARLDSLSSAMVHLTGIFVISLLVVEQSNTQAMTVSTAFIILHLTVTLYQIMPRIKSVFDSKIMLNIDLEVAETLTAELSAEREGEKININSSRTEMMARELILPYRCQFKNEEALDLTVKDNCIVEIVGESGSGKSTFLRVLLGLEKPVAGELHMMGLSPTQLSDSERAYLFAYVSQNAQLLPGSLRENLNLFGVEQNNDRELWDVLSKVFLLERVQQLPLGLDTPISDIRRSFSTGERQRIILAQATMKSSRFLILDEAMSGLPAAMEQQILENLRACYEQIYLVTHREHLRGFADLTIEMEARAYDH